MSKNKGNSSKVLAKWTTRNISIFCDLCIKEVEVGRRPGTHFNKEGWENLRENFSKETGQEYVKAQLKNKWYALKIEWKLWKELVGKETGIGWNSSKGTVDASDEWWNNKIQLKKEYVRLRKKGISPEMEEKMEEKMFMNTTATGEHAWAPSSGALPLKSRETSINGKSLERDASSSDSNPIETIHAIKTAAKRKRKACDSKVKEDDRRKKVGGAAKLSGEIEHPEGRSTAASLLIKMQSGTSIAEVIKDVQTLPGVEPPSPIFFFATDLFLSQEKREMYTAIDTPSVKLAWLNYEFNKK